MIRSARGYLAMLSFSLAVALLVRPPESQVEQGHLPPLLPRIEFLRALGAGHLELVADYYWVRTVQAAGLAQTIEQYRDIFAYADLVSDLDPRFREVYVFSGGLIPVKVDRKWSNTEESTRILEKGYRNVPEHVLLRILLAYNLSTFSKDHRRAAMLLEETSRLPRAPPYLSALATRMFAHAGDFDAGLVLAQSLVEEAQDEDTRLAFQLRYQELLLERELRRVDEAIEAFRRREGRAPPDLSALLASGDLAKRPVDPLGGEVLIGEDGQARSTSASKRLRLHQTEWETQ